MIIKLLITNKNTKATRDSKNIAPGDLSPFSKAIIDAVEIT